MIIAVLFLTLLYLYSIRNFGHWKDRRVKHDTPLPFFGTNLRQFMQKISFVDIVAEQYRKYPDEKYVGFYYGNDLMLILRDPQLIRHVPDASERHVLVTDGANFGRGMNLNPESHPEPMYRNLIFADGDLWKLLRHRMTPVFTAAKLKGIFPYVESKAKRLQSIAERLSEQRQEIDVRELMVRYTTDISGSYYFGFDVDSLNNEDCQYRKLSKRMFTVTKREAAVIILKLLFPKLCEDLEIISPKTKRTFLSILKRTAAKRNCKPSGLNDFIDCLLEMRQQGPMTGVSMETLREDGKPQTVEIEFNDALMASQVFIFFAAGVESSASAASFALHLLAYHPDIQKKCQDEVDAVLAKNDNKLSFDAVNEMAYLDMVFKEALRIFPSTGVLLRVPYKPYVMPGTGLVIDRNVKLVVPVQALQNDGRYFEEPAEFRPERFHRDCLADIAKRKVYLPFGDGPRYCIGERLATLQSLVALATVLRTCTVTPGRRTVRNPPLDPTTTMVQNVIGGLPLVLVPRQT